jgi:hypothetical protein
MYEVARAYSYRKRVMGPCTWHGRVTTVHDPKTWMFSPSASSAAVSIIASIFDQVFSTPLTVPQQLVRRTHGTHNNFFTCESSYVHDCETLECMFDQHRHGSNAARELPIGYGGKASPGRLQLALAALAQPHLTQRLQQHVFPTARLWSCGACKPSSCNLAWHGMDCRWRILRALFVPFHLRSRRQPAFCFTSAISQAQLPWRARDGRIMLSYSILAGAETEKFGHEMT